LAAIIETLDDAVGGVLAHLEKLGLKENTLVIFTSDNGGLHVPEGPHEMVTHNAPFRAGKGYLYEGGRQNRFFTASCHRVYRVRREELL
jgi:arylsulfatase A